MFKSRFANNIFLCQDHLPPPPPPSQSLAIHNGPFVRHGCVGGINIYVSSSTGQGEPQLIWDPLCKDYTCWQKKWPVLSWAHLISLHLAANRNAELESQDRSYDAALIMLWCKKSDFSFGGVFCCFSKSTFNHHHHLSPSRVRVIGMPCHAVAAP